MIIYLVMCKLKRAFLIGNLWSITDSDADLMTMHLMKKINDLSKEQDLNILTYQSYEASKYFKKNV